MEVGMTIDELIEKLKKFDGNLRGVTPGYDEFDWDDIGDPKIVYVDFNETHSGHMHCGRYEAGRISAVEINFK
jgi:hypothetical protein